MRGFACSRAKPTAKVRPSEAGIVPFAGARTARRHPGRSEHPMEGQTPYDGFRAVHPGGPKTARRNSPRDPPRETLSHAAPAQPCSPPPGGRARGARPGQERAPSLAPFARGPATPPPPPPRLLRRPLYAFRIFPPGRETPKISGNPQKMATWHIRNTPHGRRQSTPR
jgi:hypothetical protein